MDVTERPRTTIRTLIRPAVYVLFVAVAGYWIWTVLKEQAADALDLLTSGHVVPYAVAACLVNVLGLGFGALAWRALLADLGAPLPLRTAGRIFFVGILGKFVPGRLWAVAANITMGRAVGVGAPAMVAAFLLSTIVGWLAGGAMGLLVAPDVLGGQSWWLLLVPVALIVVLVRPALVVGLARQAARLLRRPLEGDLSARRGVRLSVLAQTAFWTASGTQLWLLAVAMGADPWRSLPLCLGAFALASVAGNVAVLTPDGIGVREAVITLVLAAVLPWPVAAAVAVMSRFVCTLGEATAGLCALAVRPAGTGTPPIGPHATEPVGARS